MTHILTLVSSTPKTPLTTPHIKTALEILNTTQPPNPTWLSPDKAADITLDKAPTNKTTELRTALAPAQIDFFITPAQNRRKKLLLADMDSTIVEGETLDDMAEFVGLKTQISKITAQAMEGKIDFHTAIRERVKLLKNMPVAKVKEALAQVKLNPGAEIFVRTMAANGAHCALVSGGFTFFTNPIAAQTGFHTNHGNTLCIDEETNTLTGKVGEPILDKHAKVTFLNHYINEHNLTAQDCLTIGDGANDIPMLKAAGMGLGYRPKNAVKEQISNTILYGDLTAALYAQGYIDTEFIK